MTQTLDLYSSLQNVYYVIEAETEHPQILYNQNNFKLKPKTQKHPLGLSVKTVMVRKHDTNFRLLSIQGYLE